MTREEAINHLITVRNTCFASGYDSAVEDACDMAIKALEQEPSVEIVNTEKGNENDTKYLNINVSNNEVKRNPDVVRLCSDVGILEYVRKESRNETNSQ